jgi:hypothetical protein
LVGLPVDLGVYGQRYIRRVGVLDDAREGVASVFRQLDGLRDAFEGWLASDTGQGVLATIDYFSLGDEAGRFFSHVGWYLPVHPELRRYAIKHLRHCIPFDAREAARLVGPASEHWDWITDGMRASDLLETRIAAVDDGLFCLENQRWHAAICVLLPVIEGVVSDKSGVLENMRVGRRLNEILEKESGPLDAICAANALAVVDQEIFGFRSFEDAAIEDPALNRHLVLHGRTVGFGNEVNAVRTFMLLVALVELFDGAIILNADEPPVGLRDLLDEYGPLAAFRESVRESRGLPVG